MRQSSSFMSNVGVVSSLFLGKSDNCIVDVANLVPKRLYTGNFRLPTRVAESFSVKDFTWSVKIFQRLTEATNRNAVSLRHQIKWQMILPHDITQDSDYGIRTA
jgi:hypothetical protein